MSYALRTCKVGVALYSPSYFASTYCGKEFYAYGLRMSTNPNVPGIIPVIWIPAQETPTPAAAAEVQFKEEGTFPAEYCNLGMRKLISLKLYQDLYEIAIDVLANRIAKAIKQNAFRPLDAFDIATAPSAWEEATAADPDSHKRGSINKTCFVFVSESGWNWKPYPGLGNSGRTIGATAQLLSGFLGLQYDQIPCDAGLLKKLKETRDNNVPTLIIADPESVNKRPFSDLMRSYDDVYYLNCGTLIPWQSDRTNSDGNLQLLESVFHQKLKIPPPYHEWSTIYSQDDLEARARTTIEGIRITLLQDALAGRTSTLSRAADTTIIADAASHGIRVDTLPQVQGPGSGSDSR